MPSSEEVQPPETQVPNQITCFSPPSGTDLLSPVFSIASVVADEHCAMTSSPTSVFSNLTMATGAAEKMKMNSSVDDSLKRKWAPDHEQV